VAVKIINNRKPITGKIEQDLIIIGTSFLSNVTLPGASLEDFILEMSELSIVFSIIVLVAMNFQLFKMLAADTYLDH
ncbi:MAG: hypothetical protein WAM22_01790, partial [Nitrososphaeraceae archaeon]